MIDPYARKSPASIRRMPVTAKVSRFSFKAFMIGPAFLFALIGPMFSGAASAVADDGKEAPQRVIAPLIIEDGRPYVEITLVGPDGDRAEARFLVDTGGGAFILPESVARSVGLQWGTPREAEGRKLARVESLPEALLKDYSLPLTPERVLVSIGDSGFGSDAAGLLPGHILAQHHVIFDYPGRTLTLATPDTIEPSGKAMAMPVSEPMGFPRTEIEVAGQTYGMLLDTGPPATIISQAVLEEWGEARPEWDRYDEPRGEAEALARAGGQVIGTMVAENVVWGSRTLERLTVASQREGVFEEYMSRMMTAPIVGALGSNAFMNLRIELDYNDETLYIAESSGDPGSK